ncbi:hypothetical protein ACR6C2_43665 [Streptomyces sp. INA 01156]
MICLVGRISAGSASPCSASATSVPDSPVRCCSHRVWRAPWGWPSCGAWSPVSRARCQPGEVARHGRTGPLTGRAGPPAVLCVRGPHTGSAQACGGFAGSGGCPSGAPLAGVLRSSPVPRRGRRRPAAGGRSGRRPAARRPGIRSGATWSRVPTGRRR